MLDDIAELQEALVDAHVVGQELGVDNGQDVVHRDVHLPAHKHCAPQPCAHLQLPYS